MRASHLVHESEAAWKAAGLVLAALTALAGCARVAPYDRGRLAHPTMQLGSMDHAAQAHVHSVHEGAAGGDLGASSGCGCN